MTASPQDGANGAYYIRIESHEQARAHAEASVQAMLGLSLEEAFRRYDDGEYEGTIAGDELRFLRELLEQTAP